MKLESLLQYIDAYLGVAEHPDYPTALNGLQVSGPTEVEKLAVAVDASEASIAAAVAGGADLLFVHHGLFWAGLEPVVGRHFRRLKGLIDAEIGLYACHLPLDGHAEVGNSAVLARELGVEVQGGFGTYKGVQIGCWGTLEAPVSLADLAQLLGTALSGPVQSIAGRDGPIERIGVVTGGGASFLPEAAEKGLQALVTGEASHHNYFDATELGVDLLLGGHYATETFGVRALAVHLEERFGLPWFFIDQPTGL